MRARTKVLRATTIIPERLYVPRDADRELQRAIADMGRPAYVLVARQMGKTNLLVNAKRVLQSAHDAFVYLDVSNSFDDLREFLRGVIDTALETNAEILCHAESPIRSSREQPASSAHKEHELELRQLLKAVPGKLVIILDEIDALTRSTFSDQIFSQIRKTYFSRVNFPEYNRLTYVLSGVAEPSDLIKDPKLSPFNIGEKIYLDDFTHDEYMSFLERADLLDLRDDVVRRVFYWASGNPRITWDICAAVEDALVAGSEISASTIDDIVRQLYLTSYDRAPVDHIRTLVQSDSAVRDAIIQIRYGKGAQLSDAVKSRLYLGGIVGANLRRVAIKNRIVDSSLSDQWIRDIERRNTDLLAIAHSRYAVGDYQAAIGHYEELLRSSPAADSVVTATIHYRLAFAHFRLGNFQRSVDILCNSSCNKQQLREVYYGRLSLLGACKIKLGEREAGVQTLNLLVAAGAESGLFYYEALVNLASSYLEIDPEGMRAKIIEHCAEVLRIDPTLEKDLGKAEVDRFKAVAHINLSKVYQRAGSLDFARDHLKSAARLYSPSERYSLLYMLAMLEQSKEERLGLLADAVKAIVDFDVQIGRQKDGLRVLDVSTGAEMLAVCAEVDPQGSFSALLRHLVKVARERAQPGEELLRELLHRVAETQKAGVALFVVNRVIDTGAVEAVSESVLSDCYKIAAAIDGTKSRENFLRYVKRFSGDRRPKNLDSDDFQIIFFHAMVQLRAGNYAEVRSLVEMTAPYLKGADEPDAQEGALLMHFVEMQLAEAVGTSAEGEVAAQRVLDIAASLQHETRPAPFFNADALRVLTVEARSILQRRQMRVEHAQPGIPKMGRNEWVVVRYPDGRVARGKFKKLSGDIFSSKCVVVERGERKAKP